MYVANEHVFSFETDCSNITHIHMMMVCFIKLPKV